MLDLELVPEHEPAQESRPQECHTSSSPIVISRKRGKTKQLPSLSSISKDEGGVMSLMLQMHHQRTRGGDSCRFPAPLESWLAAIMIEACM